MGKIWEDRYTEKNGGEQYLSLWFIYDVEILKRVLCTIVYVSSQFIMTYFVTFETSGSPLEFKVTLNLKRVCLQSTSPTSGIEKVKATNNEIMKFLRISVNSDLLRRPTLKISPR